MDIARIEVPEANIVPTVKSTEQFIQRTEVTNHSLVGSADTCSKETISEKSFQVTVKSSFLLTFSFYIQNYFQVFYLTCGKVTAHITLMSTMF